MYPIDAAERRQMKSESLRESSVGDVANNRTALDSVQQPM